MASADKTGDYNCDLVQQFVSVTGADETTAVHFLEACGGDLGAAIGMHLDSNGVVPASVPVAGPSKPSTSSNGRSATKRKRSRSPVDVKQAAPDHGDEVRAPIPQKHEVLVTDNVVYGRQGRRRKAQSVFDQFRDFQAEAKQHEMAQNGSAMSSSKRRTLEDLFRPPIDLLHRGTFTSARDAAASANKWLIANIQNVQEFSCQVLNRDLWSNAGVKDVVKRHFVLWQSYSDSEDGKRFMTLYQVSDWPYVAVIDPRTGEKMIAWHKLEANSFCEIATEFLELHPAPSESDVESSPHKKQRSEPSIVDASEDSQLNAAIAASLKENAFSASKSSAFCLSDDDNACMYSSDNDDELETFSDSDSSRPLPSTSKGMASQKFPVDQTVVSMPDVAQSSKSCSEVIPKNMANGAEETHSQESNCGLWKSHLGLETDPKSDIVFRCPNGLRKQLSIPCSSKLMVLVSYASELGFSQDRYDLVTTFPKRKLSQLDLSMTLRDSGFNPQETIFVQEI